MALQGWFWGSEAAKKCGCTRLCWPISGTQKAQGVEQPKAYIEVPDPHTHILFLHKKEETSIYLYIF